jgi:hypothetical protein
LLPDKAVNGSPVSAAEYFECSLCSRRFALRLQYYTPMSGGECHRTTIDALDCGRSVHKPMLHVYPTKSDSVGILPKKAQKKQADFTRETTRDAPEQRARSGGLVISLN